MPRLQGITVVSHYCGITVALQRYGKPDDR